MSIEWDLDQPPLREQDLRLLVGADRPVRVRRGEHQGAVGAIVSVLTVAGRRVVQLAVRRLEPAVGPGARRLRTGDLITLGVDEIELFP